MWQFCCCDGKLFVVWVLSRKEDSKMQVTCAVNRLASSLISFPSAVHGRPFCDNFRSGFAVHALRRGRSAFTFFRRGFGNVFFFFAAEHPDEILQPRDDCIVSRGESDPFCKQVRCPMLQSPISLPISLCPSLFQPTVCSAPHVRTLTVFRSSSTPTTRACVRKVSTFECKRLNMIP
jgi:hypothetical protein